MKRIIMLGKASRRNVIASRSYMWIACLLAVFCLAIACPMAGAAERQVRAGAAKVDITPAHLPILVNGWILQRTAKRVLDRLHSRAIVLETDGRRMAMVAAPVAVEAGLPKKGTKIPL